MIVPVSRPISDEHINAVGRLVIEVSLIDTLLTDLTAAFLRTDALGALAVVHHQQIASKISSLLALVQLRLPTPDARPLIDVLKAAKRVTDFRNSIVHAHWSVGQDGVTYTTRVSARGQLSRSRLPQSPADILRRADEAREIADQLARIRHRFLEPTT
jgi:hypothetical protein